MSSLLENARIFSRAPDRNMNVSRGPMSGKHIADFPELRSNFSNGKKMNEITIIIYILLTIVLLTKISVIN